MTSDFKRKSSTFKKLFYILRESLCLHTINKNRVLFYSFDGMYNDNPKYISEELHAQRPEVEIVWVHSSKCHDKLPDYVNCVESKTSAYYKAIFSANVVVDNYTGLRAGFSSKINLLRRLICVLYSRRFKGQYNISTWHGTPLKHLDLDQPGINRKRIKYYSGSDYFIAGCEHTKKALISGFSLNVPFKLYGTPRNDILFRMDIDTKKIKKKLSLPCNQKIVLFAPTFRENVEMSGVSQMSSLNFAKLIESLKMKFGGLWCFVVRVHHSVMQKINTAELIQKYRGVQIVDGNIGDDMAEYLACTDVLITDYSGSLFDFALTKRPCFLYAPDREQYEKVERGFYMDYDALPFPKSYTAEELVKNIASFDEIRYGQKVEKFLEDIGNVEDGHASKRVVHDILRFLDTCMK